MYIQCSTLRHLREIVKNEDENEKQRTEKNNNIRAGTQEPATYAGFSLLHFSHSFNC